MFGKSGFILRSVFVTFIVGSLVACTFEQTTPEQQGHSTSAVDGTGTNHGDDPMLQGEDASADDDIDGGAYDQDADVDGGWDWDGDVDGGGYDGSYDGGGYDGSTSDGGPATDGGVGFDAGGGF